MSGACGWFGRFEGDSAKTMHGMLARDVWSGPASSDSRLGAEFGLGVCGPKDAAWMFDSGSSRLAIFGHASWESVRGGADSQLDFARRFVDAYRSRGVDALQSLQGDFALALLDERERRLLLAVDRIGIRNIVYTFQHGVLTFGPTCDVVNAHPSVAKGVRAQGIYDYVHFHMVPGPETIFEGQRRLEPGHYLLFEQDRATTGPYWKMGFAEDRRRPFGDLKRDFRAALSSGVAAFATDSGCGSFLSGGTDSSTVSGVLGDVTGKPARTFSIGFDAAGYDEMEYARIAARHFGTNHHEYYVTQADTVAAVPVLAAAYDQPFGNASAVPTYYCARLARDSGVLRMLAGDGGDELFGGNSRYARQYQLSLYDRIPAPLRRLVLEPVVLGMPRIDRVALLRRARSYVEQARMPMPARYESYNLLHRLGPETVFEPEFLAAVDCDAPLTMLGDVYRATDATSLINQLIAIDLKFTIADNDLPKVTRMCDAAGIDVAFPLLHPAVVAFSASLPADLKLRRTRLRYFFKEALRDYLPREIIAKEKHGFGLPAGQWIRDHPPLRDLAGDALISLRKRGMFRGDVLDALTSKRIHEHASYYGTMVWILMMLELWLRDHAD